MAPPVCEEDEGSTEARILFKKLVEKEKRLAKKCITEPIDSDKMLRAVESFLKDARLKTRVSSSDASGRKKISRNIKKK